MITDIHGSPIDKIWLAEFTGFFLADGSLCITRYHRHQKDRHDIPSYHYYFYRPEATINQRADNRELLLEIASKLGGYVGGKNTYLSVTHANGKIYPCKPRVSWSCVGKEPVQRVVNILKNAKLPYRGLDEKVDIMQEYLDLMPKPGSKYGKEGRIRMTELWDKMRACHIYEP